MNEYKNTGQSIPHGQITEQEKNSQICTLHILLYAKVVYPKAIRILFINKLLLLNLKLTERRSNSMKLLRHGIHKFLEDCATVNINIKEY